MSVNSSSSSNDSLLHPNISSNHFNIPVYLHCLISKPASFIFTSYMITNSVLLIPLFIFILHHGLQQWRQKRSTSSAATMSHSDCFTYHMVAMELIGLFGSVLCCCGIYSDNLIILLVGFFLFSFTWYGQILIHVLTCVERYLAVVHPIIYLSLRQERGIRVRNISIGCAWLICIVGISILMCKESLFYDVCLLTVSFAITSFCSFSVLCVLIRPGPGEQGGGRERVDQSKQRAFYTILAMLGVLGLRFTWGIAYAGTSLSGFSTGCVMIMCEIWSNLSCSLVLPLLFLHRAGKLMCWKNSIQ